MDTPGAEIIRIVGHSEKYLQQLRDEDAAKPLRGGGWSRKQVLVHLIDSASNNHQRFVRAALQGSLDFPGYNQDACVQVQCAQEASWSVLLTLWASYNRYLAHVISHLPEDKLNALCLIGSAEPVTLRFLISDYVRHLVHHLGQIGAPVTIVP